MRCGSIEAKIQIRIMILLLVSLILLPHFKYISLRRVVCIDLIATILQYLFNVEWLLGNILFSLLRRKKVHFWWNRRARSQIATYNIHKSPIIIMFVWTHLLLTSVTSTLCENVMRGYKLSMLNNVSHPIKVFLP